MCQKLTFSNDFGAISSNLDTFNLIMIKFKRQTEELFIYFLYLVLQNLHLALFEEQSKIFQLINGPNPLTND